MKTAIIIICVAFISGACNTENHRQHQNKPLAAADPAQSEKRDQGETAAQTEKKNNTITDVKIGMRDEKVRAMLGKPTKVDIISSEPGARIEDWWYGKNQKVRITGGEVMRVVKDVNQEQENLLKIREAREKGNDAEARRMLEEMGVNN